MKSLAALCNWFSRLARQRPRYDGPPETQRWMDQFDYFHLQVGADTKEEMKYQFDLPNQEAYLRDFVRLWPRR